MAGRFPGAQEITPSHVQEQVLGWPAPNCKADWETWSSEADRGRGASFGVLLHWSPHPPGAFLEQDTGEKDVFPAFVSSTWVADSCTHRHPYAHNGFLPCGSCGAGVLLLTSAEGRPPKWEAKLLSQTAAGRSAAITEVLAGPPRQGEERPGSRVGGNTEAHVQPGGGCGLRRLGPATRSRHPM